ncbi:MAG: hypothetical protein Q7R33_05085 [Nitrosarchaeum sp.]|nr:hypothetical protein [Nitrosarchaeum sp.]
MKKKLKRITAKFDEINYELKMRFGVKHKHVNYITNNGVIQRGWLISDEEAIDDAILLLQKQAAPIYILGDYASVIVGWDTSHYQLVGNLWQNQKKIDEMITSDFSIVKSKLIEWFKKSIQKERS